MTTREKSSGFPDEMIDEQTNRTNLSPVDPGPSSSRSRPGRDPEVHTDEIRSDELIELTPPGLDAVSDEQAAANVDVPEQSTVILQADARMPALEVESGSDAGREFPIQRDRVTVGRAVDGEVVLTDIAVSRRHMRIHRRPTGWELEDLGSGNGTLLNGSRAKSSLLTDGDRIEIGRTVLVFRWADGPAPRGAAAPAPARRPPGPAAVRRAAARTEPPRAGRSDAQAAATAAQIGEAFRALYARLTDTPRKRLIFWGGTGVLGLFLLLGIVSSLTSPSTDAATAQAPNVSDVLNAGVAAFRSQDWDTAEQAFQAVLAQAPGEEGIRTYLEKTREERRNRQAYTEAQAALAGGDPVTATTRARQVTQDSYYFALAGALQQQAVAQRVSQQIRTAGDALQRGDLVAANDALSQALTLDPNNAEARALWARIAPAMPGVSGMPGAPGVPAMPGAVGAPTTAYPVPGMPAIPAAPAPPPAFAFPPSPVAPAQPQAQPAPPPAAYAAPPVAYAAPPPAPSYPRAAAPRPAPERPAPRPIAPALAPAPPVVRGTQGRVIDLYRSGQFQQAAQMARDLAQRERGRAHQQLEELATRIDGFAQDWAAIRAAQPGARSLVPNLQHAIEVDRQVVRGGAYASQLRPQLLRAMAERANRAFHAGQFGPACTDVVQTLQIDPGASGVTALVQPCRERAQEFYERGYALRSANPDQARALFRQVMQMVPRNDSLYQRAFERYSATPTAAQDEDESR